MPRARISAGLLLYRVRAETVEVLLAHPGGPYFRNRDLGAWSIPKGELDGSEDLLQAARREFAEEIGCAPDGPFVGLDPVRQKGGKTVYAFAVQGDCEPSQICSNTFSIEWPPRSGRQQEFPEIDRAEFFDLATAREKINAAQATFLDQLVQNLEADSKGVDSEPADERVG